VAFGTGRGKTTIATVTSLRKVPDAPTGAAPGHTVIVPFGPEDFEQVGGVVGLVGGTVASGETASTAPLTMGEMLTALPGAHSAMPATPTESCDAVQAVVVAVMVGGGCEVELVQAASITAMATIGITASLRTMVIGPSYNPGGLTGRQDRPASVVRHSTAFFCGPPSASQVARVAKATVTRTL